MIEVAIAVVRQYWKLFAGVFVVVFMFSFGYYKGYQAKKVKFEQHLSEDARLTAIAKAESDTKVRIAEALTNNVKKEYVDEVDKINDYYKSHPRIVRLCNSSSTSSMSSTSQSPEGVSAAVNGTTEIITEIDMNKAAQEVAQCRALIKFELEQESIQ